MLHIKYFKERLFLLKSYYAYSGRDFPKNEKDVEDLMKETLLPNGCGNPVGEHFFAIEVPDEVDKVRLYCWLANTYGHNNWDESKRAVFTNPCDPRLLELARIGCKVYRLCCNISFEGELCLSNKNGWVKYNPSTANN